MKWCLLGVESEEDRSQGQEGLIGRLQLGAGFYHKTSGKPLGRFSQGVDIT